MDSTVHIVRAAPDELAGWFASDIAREFRAAAASHAIAQDATAQSTRTRPFTFAVPGGSVATHFLPRLVAAPVDWDRVELFFTDERAVPPTSPDSNYALAQRLWLRPGRVPEERVHRMLADRADVAVEAEAYATALEAAASSPPTLDYVLLGVGEDGHVASIFPGRSLSGGTGAVGWTDDAPKAPALRMTLTMATLARARRVVVAAFDAGKRAAIAQALDDPTSTTPLGTLLRGVARPVLLLGTEVGL